MQQQQETQATPFSIANRNFAINLFKQIQEVSASQNKFISPLNISTCISMLLSGSAGNTEAEIKKALNFDQIQDPHTGFQKLEELLNSQKDFQLATANKIWPNKASTFVEQFLVQLKQNYNNETQPLDFQSQPEESRKIINEWVEQKTNNKIQDLIPSGCINPLTRMVLTSAIYFKGNWENKFDAKHTKQVEFNPENAEPAKIDMMYKHEGKYGYTEDPKTKSQFIQMPYEGNNVSMFVILPAKETKMAEFISQLNEQQLGLMENQTNERKISVNVTFPKFKITYEKELNKPLQNLGIKEAFLDSANFSKMIGENSKEPLYVSTVLHKAFIEVNEEGTEAAAATAVIMKTRCMKPPSPNFRADRPFLYYIRDNQQKNILFMGTYEKP